MPEQAPLGSARPRPAVPKFGGVAAGQNFTAVAGASLSMAADAAPDPGATYEGCLVSLKAVLDDPATLERYFDVARGRRLATLSEAEAYRVLVSVRFAAGYPWPEFERYRGAVLDAFPDPETVAAYDDADVEAALRRDDVPASESKVRAARSYAESMRSTTADDGGFVDRIRETTSYDDAMASLTALDHVGETTAHRFLVAVGYVPALARDDGVARLLKRVGFEPSAAARERVVQSMVDDADAAPAVVARVLRVHAGSDARFAGPTLAGRDPVFEGICITPPACSHCRVPACASRRTPPRSE